MSTNVAFSFAKYHLSWPLVISNLFRLKWLWQFGGDMRDMVILVDRKILGCWPYYSSIFKYDKRTITYTYLYILCIYILDWLAHQNPKFGSCPGGFMWSQAEKGNWWWDRCWNDAFPFQDLIQMNMERANTPLEEENNLSNHHFQVLCWSSGAYMYIYLYLHTTE